MMKKPNIPSTTVEGKQQAVFKHPLSHSGKVALIDMLREQGGGVLKQEIKTGLDAGTTLDTYGTDGLLAMIQTIKELENEEKSPDRIKILLETSLYKETVQTLRDSDTVNGQELEKIIRDAAEYIRDKCEGFISEFINKPQHSTAEGEELSAPFDTIRARVLEYAATCYQAIAQAEQFRAERSQINDVISPLRKRASELLPGVYPASGDDADSDKHDATSFLAHYDEENIVKDAKHPQRTTEQCETLLTLHFIKTVYTEMETYETLSMRDIQTIFNESKTHMRSLYHDSELTASLEGIAQKTQEQLETGFLQVAIGKDTSEKTKNESSLPLLSRVLDLMSGQTNRRSL